MKTIYCIYICSKLGCNVLKYKKNRRIGFTVTNIYATHMSDRLFRQSLQS